MSLGLALALLACLPGPARAERLIQIGIAPRARELTIVARGRWSAAGPSGGSKALPSGEPLKVEAASDGRLRVGPLTLSSPVTLRPREDDSRVELRGHSYAGPLRLLRDPEGATVTAVQELGIERYLLGVLPYEMDQAWPLDALKAQAVVARTFAYTQLDKYRKDGFDLTGDTRSQVYGGQDPPGEAVRLAVQGTHGEVLGYKGKILEVYYHSCCGGHTESPAEVWGGEAPAPLRGVRDPWCRASPLASWTAYVTFDRLAAALEKNHLTGGKLTRLRVAARDVAGYATSFVARVGRDTVRIKAGELRAALGVDTLRSVRIAGIRRRKRGVEFSGGGSGHGVGLCQWGARLQAQAGRSYEDILRFYFPGSTLSVVDE